MLVRLDDEDTPLIYGDITIPRPLQRSQREGAQAPRGQREAARAPNGQRCLDRLIVALALTLVFGVAGVLLYPQISGALRPRIPTRFQLAAESLASAPDNAPVAAKLSAMVLEARQPTSDTPQFAAEAAAQVMPMPSNQASRQQITEQLKQIIKKLYSIAVLRPDAPSEHYLTTAEFSNDHLLKPESPAYQKLKALLESDATKELFEEVEEMFSSTNYLSLSLPQADPNSAPLVLPLNFLLIREASAFLDKTQVPASLGNLPAAKLTTVLRLMLQSFCEAVFAELGENSRLEWMLRRVTLKEGVKDTLISLRQDLKNDLSTSELDLLVATMSDSSLFSTEEFVRFPLRLAAPAANPDLSSASLVALTEGQKVQLINRSYQYLAQLLAVFNELFAAANNP